MKIISGVEPISYGIKGGTSRFSSVNDSIVIENKTALLLIENSFYNWLSVVLHHKLFLNFRI